MTSIDTATEPTRGQASGREFVLLVTALMALMAVAIDLMLPAFPEIRQEFGMPSDSTRVSLIITAYFLGMAFGPWIYGPASDRFGRKPLVVVGLGLYAAAAVVAALAPSWPLLVASRFVWGLGAAGPRTLAQAMIRDRYEGDAMARLMSMIMAVFLLVPIIAPTVGAGLIAVLPWRSVLWAPALIATVLVLWSRRLPETLPPENRRPFTWSAVGLAATEVVRNRQTLSLTIAMTFLFATLTAYLTTSEVVLEDVYDRGSWFPVFFGVIAVLLAVNSLNNARLVSLMGAIGLSRRLAIGGTVMGAVLVGVTVVADGRPSFWVFAVVLGLTLPLAQGLSPTLNALAMAPLPHVAGTAASIITTATVAGGSILGGVASNAFDGSVTPYAVFTFGYLAVAAVFTLIGLPRTPTP